MRLNVPSHIFFSCLLLKGKPTVVKARFNTFTVTITSGTFHGAEAVDVTTGKKQGLTVSCPSCFNASGTLESLRWKES